jgi:hypothetical protein
MKLQPLPKAPECLNTPNDFAAARRELFALLNEQPVNQRQLRAIWKPLAAYIRRTPGARWPVELVDGDGTRNPVRSLALLLWRVRLEKQPPPF